MNSHKKKVLHISHTDIRIDGRILKELDALHAEGGYEVKAIGALLNEDAPPVEENTNFRVEALSLITNSSRWRPHLIRYCLAATELLGRIFVYGVREKPHLVHCHDTLALPAAILIRTFTGCRVIYDAHELESNKNGSSSLYSKVTLFIEKICWSSVDALISVSPSIIQWYMDNLGLKKNTLILNTPRFEEQEFKVEESDRYFHRKFSIPENRFVFLYLGILGKGRGIEKLLNAFSREDIASHVVFMGYGPLGEKISSLSLQCPRIHLHKPVRHDQVVSLTKSADVGLCFIENVSLSDFLCLPNKLFEYAFSGLTILASDFPDMKQVIEEYGLGKCSANDAEAIYDAIKVIENDGVASSEQDLSALSWSTQESKLLKLYDEVLM